MPARPIGLEARLRLNIRTRLTVNVRGALGFFELLRRSANRPAAMASDSPSRPARTTRVIILSSSATPSSLDVWDEEPDDDGVDVVVVDVVVVDVDANPATCAGCHRRRPECGRSGRSPTSLC